MKKSKTPLELHHVHSEAGTYDLAYLVLFAMAHVLLLTCVMMTVAEYADSITVLSIFKMLIVGHVLIGLVILSPLAYTFSKHDQSKTIVGTRIKGHKSELSKSSNKAWTLIQCIAMYISGIAFIHFVSVLFGAPLVRDIDKTCHFAMLLSTTAILPGIILFGCCQEEWVRVFILGKTNNVLEYVIRVTTVTSVVGAWLGAFPIPLDWDRPWQVWPISCVIGTVIGFDAGLLGGIAFLQYTRLRMAQDRPREGDCIFCKISHHEDPKTTLLYEDDDFVAFQDLRPASQHHYLVVPKWHIKDAKQLQFNDLSLVNRLEEVGSDLLRRQGGDVSDVKMGFHWPPFHLVSHLHLHVISPVGDMKLMSKAIFMDSSPWFVSVDWLKRRLREMEPQTPDSESG